MTVVFSTQAVEFGKNKKERKSAFSGQELDKNKVPHPAYDLTNDGEIVSFKCIFNSLGDPAAKK